MATNLIPKAPKPLTEVFMTLCLTITTGLSMINRAFRTGDNIVHAAELKSEQYLESTKRDLEKERRLLQEELNLTPTE